MSALLPRDAVVQSADSLCNLTLLLGKAEHPEAAWKGCRLLSSTIICVYSCLQGQRR